jgi:hypothetical protein
MKVLILTDFIKSVFPQKRGLRSDVKDMKKQENEPKDKWVYDL